jgi:hypothetical protein
VFGAVRKIEGTPGSCSRTVVTTAENAPGVIRPTIPWKSTNEKGDPKVAFSLLDRLNQ